MIRIYLSGPMDGLPDNNYPAFFKVAARLKSMGYVVVNPADLDHAHDASRHEIMRRDLAALLTCNAIYLLAGWEDSCGSRLEFEIAREIGLIIWQQTWITGGQAYPMLAAASGGKTNQCNLLEAAGKC